MTNKDKHNNNNNNTVSGISLTNTMKNLFMTDLEKQFIREDEWTTIGRKEKSKQTTKNNNTITKTQQYRILKSLHCIQLQITFI